MSTSEKDSLKYFRYYGELGLPIYIRYFDNGDFGHELSSFLETMKFEACKNEDVEAIELELEDNSLAKCLEISLSSGSVARQINSVLESDTFGHESIVTNPGYHVYRYKGQGLMVYSSVASLWKLGVFENFGFAQNEFNSRVMLFRYLSWAMAPMGIIGFWGTTKNEGMCAMKQKDSKGEVVFYDYQNSRVFSLNGVVPIRSSLNISCIDIRAISRRIVPKDELMSLLSTRCSFFDVRGFPTYVRQLLHKVVIESQGEICNLDHMEELANEFDISSSDLSL